MIWLSLIGVWFTQPGINQLDEQILGTVEAQA